MCTPYIVISFLAFQSNSSSFVFVQLMISAAYLTMETALKLMAEKIFPSFNFKFSLFLTFCDIFFLYLTFHFFMLYTSSLQNSKIFVPIFLNIIHCLSIRHTYSFTLTIFLFMINTPHFVNPDSILMSSEKCLTVFTKLFN